MTAEQVRRRQGAGRAIVTVATALLIGGCAATAARPPAKLASPGFRGKVCEMVSPELPAVDALVRSPPGKVRARAHFVDGEVTAVEILSGPKVYRQPVVDAMRRYTCEGGLTFVAEQTFVFGDDPRLPTRKR